MEEKKCASNHPPVRASFDIGYANFAYFMGTPREDLMDRGGGAGGGVRIPHDVFMPVMKPKRWVNVRLPGSANFEWNESLMEQMDKEPMVTHSRCKIVYIESQIATKNPVMYGIASGVQMNFLMRRNLQVTCFPEQIVGVGASSKFSYLYIETPNGEALKEVRKRLSIEIVRFLFDDWTGLHLVKEKWLAFYASFRDTSTGRLKLDDLADCFLQCWTETCKEYGIVPAWTCLERLYMHLCTVKVFADDGDWPLRLTAEGNRKYTAYVKRSEKEADAKKRKRDRKKRAPGRDLSLPLRRIIGSGDDESGDAESISDSSAERKQQQQRGGGDENKKKKAKRIPLPTSRVAKASAMHQKKKDERLAKGKKTKTSSASSSSTKDTIIIIEEEDDDADDDLKLAMKNSLEDHDRLLEKEKAYLESLEISRNRAYMSKVEEIDDDSDDFV